jgi:hypothetical protein
VYCYLQEVQEMLHHIELALSIADKGAADVVRSAHVAQNVLADICHTECTQQRMGS